MGHPPHGTTRLGREPVDERCVVPRLPRALRRAHARGRPAAEELDERRAVGADPVEREVEQQHLEGDRDTREKGRKRKERENDVTTPRRPGVVRMVWLAEEEGRERKGRKDDDLRTTVLC